MWQNYFTYKGKTYRTGTIFTVKEFNYCCGICEKEATFIAYNTEYDMAKFKIGDVVHSRPSNMLDGWIISVTDKLNENARLPVEKQRKDAEIDGLFEGWIVYIFLMIISIIFNGNIGFWILWSYLFFSWRNKKIKEEGTYIEW